MHGLLDVIGCRDVVDSILDKCGVMCLARLAVTSKSTRAIIDQYNRRTKRIFPVRCGGFDHEHYTFWATYKRERAAEVETLNRPSPPSTLKGGDTNNLWNSSLSPSSYGRTIQIPASRLPTRSTLTIQATDPLRPQRSTANHHNLRYPSIASGVRLFEPAPLVALDWPRSQKPNLLNLDIAHRVAMTYP